MPVVALLTSSIEINGENIDGEVCVLSEIEGLPTDILNYVVGRVPTYKYKYSKTIGAKYYANTCGGCGMLSGDFFLHSEPGGPFFPTSVEDAEQLYIVEVPFQSPAEIEAGFHVGTGDLILRHAKKIT